jgi:hypothetical protein
VAWRVALLPLVHSYTAIGLGAVLATGFLFEAAALLRVCSERRFAAASLLAVAAFGALPAGLAFWQSQDTVYRLTSARAMAAEDAAPLWLWAVSLGVLLPGGLAGLPGLLRDERFCARLIGAWIVGVTAIALIPVLSPARHLYLLPLPLAIATARAFERLRPRLPPRLASPRAVVVALALLAGGSLFTVLESVRELRVRFGYYLTRPEFEAMVALRELEPGGVLSHGKAGLFLPWLARKPVFTGHWFLSLVYDPDTGAATMHEMLRFFSRRVDAAESAWRAQLLRRNDVRYVWFGILERQLAGAPDPSLGLRRVIDTGAVQVYEVPRSEP